MCLINLIVYYVMCFYLGGNEMHVIKDIYLETSDIAPENSGCIHTIFFMLLTP